MTGNGAEFSEAVAALSVDAAFARFVGADAAIAILDGEGERLLWALPGSDTLRRALVDEHGQVPAGSPLAARLKALASGLAPRAGVRLERLRLPLARVDSLVTAACRRLEMPSGEAVLLIAIPGLAKDAPANPVPLPAATLAESAPDVAAAEASEPAAGPPAGRAKRASGTVRFLWHADAEGRFTSVSDALAEIVGEAADVLGRRWDELAGRVVEDPGGAISRAFAAGETWTGQVVRWRIGGSDEAVPVDLAGMPVHGRDGRLIGFRGFGLCRTDGIGADAPFADGGEAPEVADELGEAALPDGEEGGRDDAAEPAAASATHDDVPLVDENPVETTEETETAVEPADGEAHAAGLDAPLASEREPEDAPSEKAISFAAIGGAIAGRLGDPRIPLRIVDEPEPAVPSDGQEPPVPGPAPPARAAPRLSTVERSAFREIARALGARFDEDEPGEPEPWHGRPVVTPLRAAPPVGADAERILDRLPAGVLIHRGDEPLFANRLLLDLVDYDDVRQLAAEGGVPRLFRSRAGPLARLDESAPLALTTRANESVAVEVRLTTVEWDGLPASLMLIRKAPDAELGQRLRALELDLRAREARLRELSAILDTATDGVLVLDDEARILSLNRSAEALFGYEENEVVGERLIVLLSPESHGPAGEYLEGLRGSGVASLLNDGREVFGRVRQGGVIPLFMTVGQVSEGPERKYCAVLRDITAFKKTEGELLSAKRLAEEGSAQKSDFLAKVSHEIRTPLNAIIGFAEVMLEERFGPIGNERYKDYLRDIHTSGGHVISLVNDLLDLAKVEAGRMELAFTSVKLNEVVAACVALMQPQAARERIVMRTSFAPKLPAVVADERSLRQIVLNIIANAIRFSEAGGQVIVSTALSDRGEVGIRVRDTGLGMSAEDVTAALEPFRQLATSRRGGGTGLGLPLTKALVEANRGTLRITSARNEGTLVEVLFPPTRVLAE